MIHASVNLPSAIAVNALSLISKPDGGAHRSL